MATYTIYPVQTTVQSPSILGNAVEGVDVVISAIIAGILLYFLNKSFLNNVPAYIAIIAGFLLEMYLGQYTIVRNLGFVLLVDGIYKLIQQYITISS